MPRKVTCTTTKAALAGQRSAARRRRRRQTVICGDALFEKENSVLPTSRLPLETRAEVFSPWSVLRCFQIEKLHGWSWRHWCLWRSCSFFVISKTCRSPILPLLIMSAAVCDHVESQSVLLLNSVASRGKSGRVRTRKFLKVFHSWTRNSCVLHPYSLGISIELEASAILLAAWHTCL